MPTLSTDTLEPHFDIESLSTMSSPPLSAFSPITDDDNVLENANIDLKPEILPPLALTSFVPIVEKLKGLVCEDNTYHLDAPMLSTNIEDLIDFSRRVEDLMLTDLQLDRHDYRKVSPNTITRLARMQNNESPYLCSLKHLRLVDADLALCYLDFCITPTLESLEISGIPPSHHVTISYFLKELAHHVPTLSSIHLGPGLLSKNVLNVSLKFPHLHHLTIADAAKSLDFGFLREISALPELQSLVIEARGDFEYKRSESALAKAMHIRKLAAMGTPVPPLGDEFPAEDQILSVSSQVHVSTAFPALTKLSITSNILLMGDLVYYIFPQSVEEVSLTLVRHKPVPLPRGWSCQLDRNPPDAGTVADLSSLKEAVTTASKASAMSPWNDFDYSPPVDRAPQPHSPDQSQNVAPRKGKTRTKIPPRLNPRPESYPHCNYCPDGSCSNCLSTKHSDAEAKQEAKRLAELEEAKQVRSYTESFASVIQVILEFGNPETLSIGRFDTEYFVKSISVSVRTSESDFPLTVFSQVLSHPLLVNFTIKDWPMRSVEHALLDRSSHPKASTLMKTIYLPVDPALNTGVTLPALRLIAQRYPNLLKFQSHIATSTEPLTFSMDGSIVGHGLEVLSVGGGPFLTEEEVSIATYLWFLFPSLKTLQTHREYEEDDWMYIEKLVKMCQAVRAAA